ncbi:D-tagatose-bisphosphate aldolase, class II, non-catalytic subunit [Paucibacter sp. APW11]|uniref:D-tagatose-bisphosphate aldolase, class II, non-catalytic subunit n=1 Tax=Roseateles aquae TaxID=3077235 RepID=A0ABU3P934_9BURK|nr:D-tagatose-bisphosphate aldolase, class II, non-catalytic subunit [Paucibacter sp. APW11]MDT8999077.1 D-tagatose-bisphosphate aldolase, class II, non-catalytic subunit [Paucibacter sp. APW11]
MSWILDTIAAHKAGHSVGVYSVCSANEHVLNAAIDVALAHGSGLLIESTSNQVDQFGGYTGMQPALFRDWVLGLAAARGLAAERLALGGDHLGPNAWQSLPAEAAMGHARDLIAAYVEAGFEKIHLDCSMRCADDPAVLSDDTIAVRSAQLCAVAEAAARRAGRPAPVYVIGTEVPVPGGETGEGSGASGIAVTAVAAAARTVAVHREAFERAGVGAAWPRVLALVVQPGVDFDHSAVLHYRPEQAAALAEFGRTELPGMVFEAHSTDYQTEAALHRLVHDHFAILKVGPAVTFALREAWFALSAIEAQLLPPEARADLPAVLERRMLAQPGHWQKYYGGDAAQQRLLRQFSLSDRCRYYWADAEVQAALQRLLANLDGVQIPLPLLSQYLPEQHEAVVQGQLLPRARALAEHRVGQLLGRYARACQHNRHEGAPS